MAHESDKKPRAKRTLSYGWKVPATVEGLLERLNDHGGVCYAEHAELIRAFMEDQAGKLERELAIYKGTAIGLEQRLSALSATRQSDFEWLATFKCNHYHLTRNDDHASNYTTAKEWIEVFSAPDFEDVDPAELQVMKDTNTIWCLHVYDQTPIGFYRWYGATLASVVKQAREHFESATSDGTAKGASNG